METNKQQLKSGHANPNHQDK